MTYRTPELFPLGLLDHEFWNAAARRSDWRIRRIEKSLATQGSASALRLAELSRQFGLTPDHLGRVFKQQVGVRFRDFALKERLYQAATKLLQTEGSVKEIAGEAGYQHASDFSRTFKRLFGVTPQEFRRRKRGQTQEC